MARVYDVAVAALAIGADKKWLDNLTTQHTIPGTDHFARGVPRRLAMKTLVTASIVRELNRELGVPVARGVALAGRMLGDATTTSVESPSTLRITAAISVSVDIQALEREIERRLLEAMETVVPRRRGRPPAKERRGTR